MPLSLHGIVWDSIIKYESMTSVLRQTSDTIQSISNLFARSQKSLILREEKCAFLQAELGQFGVY